MQIRTITTTSLLLLSLFLVAHTSYALDKPPEKTLPSGSVTGSPSSGSLTGSKSPSADSGGGMGLTNPLSVNSLPEFINAILRGVVEIGSIFLTLMIVYVGFLFVAARGKEEDISKARSALVWTVVGGLILLGAEAISLVIQETVKTL